MDHNKYRSYLRMRFPNSYMRHYKAHLLDGNLRERIRIARMKLDRMQDFDIKDTDSLELLADYILAEDHERGLSLKREANEVSQDNEEYPPLGEGAQEYHLREWVTGAPITFAEKRLTKVCEVCRCKFIDSSRAKNAKVCGQTCREKKDALRKRADYNKSELGLQNEKRLKRYRVRQDFEYPFYSPLEMYELASRSEQIFEDKKIERQAYKRSEEYDEWKLHGKRKRGWVSDKFGELSEKTFAYQPTSRERFAKDNGNQNGEVIVRTLGVDVTEEQLDAEKWANVKKMRGLGVLQPYKTREIRDYTSENSAI